MAAVGCFAAWMGGPSNAAAADRITLDEAIDRGLAQHPRTTRDDAIVRRRHHDVRTARHELLPELDLAAELHRGTGNVVPGGQLPLSGVPSIAGPPRTYRFDGGVWGSGIGLAARYDVAAIAGRLREVDRALAVRRGAEAERDLDRLDVAVRVAAAYLDALEAEAHQRTAIAFEERSAALVAQTEALVGAELQPGAALSRARAELAAARAVVASAQARRDEALTRLAAAMGRPDEDVEVVADLGALDRVAGSSAATASHPRMVVASARVAEADSTRRAAALAYMPRVELVAALWARGSGLDYPRAFDAGNTGLVADAGNWTVGVVVTMPLLGLPSVVSRHRAAKEDSTIARAERDQIALELRASVREAESRRDGARKVAATTPAQVDAARESLNQASARYDAGLGRLLEVAEASRLLAEAQETDDRARIDVARAELLRARARGDLAPFLGQRSMQPRGAKR